MMGWYTKATRLCATHARYFCRKGSATTGAELSLCTAWLNERCRWLRKLPLRRVEKNRGHALYRVSKAMVLPVSSCSGIDALERNPSSAPSACQGLLRDSIAQASDTMICPLRHAWPPGPWPEGFDASMLIFGTRPVIMASW